MAGAAEPEQYEVTRNAGTEPAFTGPYWDEKGEGMYRCVGCRTELFSSDTKFDSGTGWPSFTEPVNLEHVELRPDNSLFMRRTEVVCKHCDAHLGHVFDDGPPERGGQATASTAAHLASTASRHPRPASHKAATLEGRRVGWSFRARRYRRSRIASGRTAPRPPTSPFHPPRDS